jgi:hypothetical protein
MMMKPCQNEQVEEKAPIWNWKGRLKRENQRPRKKQHPKAQMYEGVQKRVIYILSIVEYA